MNKYHAKKAEADGHTFDSLAERTRYWVLKQRQETGEISGLHVHPSWTLEVNGHKLGRYTADFCYWDGTKTVVEDVKSKPTRTRDYVLRRKLMAATWAIDVVEVS